MSKTFSKKGLTPKSENISDWYNDIVVLGDLADYSIVKGSMIIKPNGYAIWEKVQQDLDKKFKQHGVKNVYFPLFIPMSLLQKEKDHLEGFSPELAVVTHAGGEELAEPLVVRPTSETIMYKTFADWIQSYRDLPLLTNQWCNVVRWEKRTHPFLRTSEFLWQEGHTVHATPEEADAQARKALGWYADFYRTMFAIDPYVGIKSASERFAGAKETYTIELVMPDGKALQAATSHDLSDNFSKVFEIEYLDVENKKQNPFQTSWGLSTRAIGGLILTHGDDSGLVIPPHVAPIQVVVVALGDKDDEVQTKILHAAEQVHQTLKGAGLLVECDSRVDQGLGSRINKWELQGVPVRLEIGAKELESNQVKWVRRDTFEKDFVDLADLTVFTGGLLEKIQENLLQNSIAIKQKLTKEVDSYDEFKRILLEDRSLMRVLWCEEASCEAKVKEETKAVSRCLELDLANEQLSGECIFCGMAAHRKWLFGQSY
jgi:prolyl-tRNA synthetase